MNKQPTVLVLAHYYLPGYKSGGPVRSISNLIEKLGDDIDFRLITLGWDVMEKVPYSSVKLDAWNRVGKAEIWYIGRSLLSILHLFRAMRHLQVSAVYLNSLFDLTFSLLPLIILKSRWLSTNKTILAPRGELSPGALEIKSRRKKFFIRLARKMGLYRSILWHASTDMEARDIEFAFNSEKKIKSQIIVAVDLLDLKPKSRPLQNRHSVVFISRITRKKNLDFALSALAECKSEIEFNIFGTIEDKIYWKECLQIIRRMPDNIRVNYRGTLNPDRVIAAFQEHSLFFFPTRGENYGHVIAESLAAGIPVLISDQTPWNNIEEAEAGWVRSLNSPQVFTDILDRFMRTDEEGIQKIFAAVYDYAIRHLDSPVDLDRNRQLFLST